MGDGWIDSKSSKNPCLKSDMISKNYLKYIDAQFQVFSRGVRLVVTAEESAKDVRDRGFRVNAESKNYSDIYRWSSISHPNLKRFSDWYKSGKKIWPDDIELTPTVLKHWYCCDGSWDNSGLNNRIRIAMSNEIDNTNKVDLMFDGAQLPEPSNYDISERGDGSKICDCVFTVKQSEELWEYMGEPLPDFEYKWPEKYK